MTLPKDVARDYQDFLCGLDNILSSVRRMGTDMQVKRAKLAISGAVGVLLNNALEVRFLNMELRDEIDVLKRQCMTLQHVCNDLADRVEKLEENSGCLNG